MSTVEDATLSWFSELGYGVLHGPDIAPDVAAAERGGFDEVILAERLRDAIDRFNTDIPAEARDEAFCSQYDMIDGFARHLRDALPNASFIGFTGTPIELDDKNTRAVFGDYVSVYDIQRAVDHATVPIYYESRIAIWALMS